MEINKSARKVFAQLGKLGGKARAERLTQSERTAIARKGAKARWAKWRAEKAAS